MVVIALDRVGRDHVEVEDVAEEDQEGRRIGGGKEDKDEIGRRVRKEGSPR